MARAAIVTSGLLVAGQFAAMSPASALPPAATFVDLGTAATYSALGGTGVTTTGAATALWGDLGLSPGGALVGFAPGSVAGTTHDKDAAAEAAQEDRAGLRSRSRSGKHRHVRW